MLDDAVEVLVTGWDTGVDLGVEHAFERSLPIEEAMRHEVMLAWAHNGQPLLPQHGFPLRLIVPSWYGMTSVKWLAQLRCWTGHCEAFSRQRFIAMSSATGYPVSRCKRSGSIR